MYRCTNQRCRSPVNNISTRSLIPATRVYREIGTFTRSATREFFYAVHEAWFIARRRMRVPPLEIAFAQMTRRSLGSSVLALRIFSYACKSLKVITMFRGETRQPVYFPAFFPRAIAYLNAYPRCDVGATFSFFLCALIRLRCMRKDTCLCNKATVYVAAFIERNSSSNSTLIGVLTHWMSRRLSRPVRYNRNGHDLFHPHTYKI